MALPTSSESESLGLAPSAAKNSAQREVGQQASGAALLKVLRDALAAGHHSLDGILQATADAAQILTGADGTAIALRTDGLVICRARSGEIAPAMGTALNVESGISGACFRTSRVLRCDNAETDDRVEPEVCRVLGIRSIAVVPLRDRLGAAGILEVFSSRAHAFTDEQIGFLKGFGEIAEAAYERDAGAGFTPAAVSHPITPSPAAHEVSSSPSILDEPAPKARRRDWMVGGAAALMLLAASVVWWTWHQPIGESATNQTAQTQPVPTETAKLTAPVVPFSKPSPRTARNSSDRGQTTGVVRNAAKLEAVEDPSLARPSNVAAGGAGSSAAANPSTDPSSAVSPASSPAASSGSNLEEPPVVVLPDSDNGGTLTNIIRAPAALPGLEVRISQGVTQGNVIHKVDPSYPQDALMARIEGTVTVEATVAEDGTVGEVTVLRGEPVLGAAAVAAVRQWRYAPSLLNGKPTAVQREVTVIFKLH